MADKETRKLPPISESLNNFHKTDDFTLEEEPNIPGDEFFRNEKEFWNLINKNVQKSNYCWGKEIEFYEVIVSEWVPRIPGVFHTKKGKELRELAKNEIISRTERSVTYTPLGKGFNVTGGLGTFKCSPHPDYRMVSINASGNCSAGIPLLISNEQWNHFELREGLVLHNLCCKWEKMSENWSEKFKSSTDLIRGCLTLVKDEINIREDWETKAPKIVQAAAHPYTILEYYKNDLPYYDFMFFSKNENWNRDRETEWLENYRTDNDRNGRYIFEPDPNETIYNAEYKNPTDYLNRGMEDLRIIDARIEEILRKESPGLFDEIYQFLCKNIAKEDDLVRISSQKSIRIPPVQWRGQNGLLRSIKVFLDLVIDQKKMTSLYDLLQTDYPQEFVANPRS